MIERSCTDFMNRLSSGEPVPGGGGASALCGGMCASLASMVCNLTVGKKKYAEAEEDVKAALLRLTGDRDELMNLIEKDAEAFFPLSQAYGLPKKTEEEIERRNAVLEEALVTASQPPLRMLEVVCRCIDELPFLAEKGSRLAVSDVGVAAAMGKAALQGTCLNVYINTKLMKNRETAERLNEKARALTERGCEKAEQVYRLVEGTVRGCC